MAGIVVVFDFDKTIIDCDSDNWVLENLGVSDMFEELLLTMPWNTAMDIMMKELHSQGRSIDDIAESLTNAPMDPKVISAIKSAHALGCDLRVVSDANVFFIETILKHHDLIDCFTEINTNPGFVDEEGRLRIMPYHEFTGLIIERIKASAFAEGKTRFIYLGDGKGDFCPMTKLKEEDFVLPRINFPVWDLICSNPSIIKAEIHEWSNWDEQGILLLKLITKIICDVGIISSDSHFQAISIPTPRPLRQAV